MVLIPVGQVVVILTVVACPRPALPHPRATLTIGGLVSGVPGPGGILAMTIVTGVVPVKRGALATVNTITVMILKAVAIGVAICVGMAIG